MYYVRKIDWEKWDQNEPLNIMPLSDVFEDNGEVSVWMDDDSPNKYVDLILALMLSGSKLSDVYCVRISDAIVEKNKIEFWQENSTTPYEDMRPLHTNMLTKDLFGLGNVAEAVYCAIKEGQYKYIPVQTLKERYYDLLKADKIEINLSEKGKWNAIYWEVAKIKGKIDFTGHKKSLLK